MWSGAEAVDVLRFALAAYESSASGGIGVNPRNVIADDFQSCRRPGERP